MIVLLRLADQYTLAQVVELADEDTASLRTYAVYEDQHVDVLDVAGAKRGDDVGQWRELPPMLGADEPPVLSSRETSVDSEPDMPPPPPPPIRAPKMPLMVIIQPPL